MTTFDVIRQESTLIFQYNYFNFTNYATNLTNKSSVFSVLTLLNLGTNTFWEKINTLIKTNSGITQSNIPRNKFTKVLSMRQCVLLHIKKNLTRKCKKLYIKQMYNLGYYKNLTTSVMLTQWLFVLPRYCRLFQKCSIWFLLSWHRWQQTHAS